MQISASIGYNFGANQHMDGSIDPAPVTCPIVGLPVEPSIPADGGPAGTLAFDPVIVSLPFPLSVQGGASHRVAAYIYGSAVDE